MFEASPMLAENGGLAIAVLAEVQGLYMAWQLHGSGSGSVSCYDIVVPAANIAKQWTVSENLATIILDQETNLLSGAFPLFS